MSKKAELPEDNNPIKSNLEQQFKDLNKDQQLPEDLKDEVFGTLDSLRMLGNFVDLFTTKFTVAEAQIIDVVSDSSSEDPPEELKNQKPPSVSDDTPDDSGVSDK